MNGQYWQEDALQFPRLLAEIRAAGLTNGQVAALCQSMDLQPHNICDLLRRAEIAWEDIKGTPGGAEARMGFPPIRCRLCAHWDADDDPSISIDGSEGTCRQQGPRVIPAGPGGEFLETRWPRTRGIDWCSQGTTGR